MKTNQVLTRRMGQFGVSQRTSDGMFNATALLKQWNSTSKQRKDIDDFLGNKATKEYVNTIISREFDHTQNSGYDVNISKSVVKKSRANKGVNAGTWMHPFLFIDFAMWLNPEFKYDVIKFVHDELIKYRNDAGDAYRDMSAAVAKIVRRSEMQASMQHVAKALNHIVFGAHESELRNKQADEIKMRELFELERKIAGLIDENFISSYDGLMRYLRKLWNRKYQPKILQTA